MSEVYFEHPDYEDEEDRLIREGQAAYEAMTPEERARGDKVSEELFEAMQAPGNTEAIAEVFRSLGQRATSTD
jgi:hypothetical protein